MGVRAHSEMIAVAGESHTSLTFESLLTDPLIRLMAESDGVSVEAMLAALKRAEAAAAGRSDKAEVR